MATASAYSTNIPAPDKMTQFDKDKLVRAVWCRYEYMRDAGHDDFIRLAEKCQQFWWGEQWEYDDMARLKASRRPALTINLVMQTMDVMVGEQIGGRNEIRFTPRYGTTDDRTAMALNMVFKHISQGNHLTWLRTDVFEDGNITGRGFYDVRLDFSENMFGEAKICSLNPKNVLIDPDADQYDPDTWEDVITTEWMSPTTIEVMYGKEMADRLRPLAAQYSSQTSDVPEQFRDRFALPQYLNKTAEGTTDQDAYIRVVDRQWRQITRREFFVDVRTGEMRGVPDDWDPLRIAQYLMANTSVIQLSRIAKRVRWTVVAGNEILHDGWSPYEFFTVVPYFPHFRYGKTVGITEQLFSVQQLLNKTASQELHVLNSTANSGWKVKKGALVNMTIDDLERRGAETGLVLELDNPEDAQKIEANQIPQGLETMNQKAQAWIKAISGVTDYMRGEAREDVSARALEVNRAQGLTGMARVLDNLDRSDIFLARAILNIVQTYYVEERLLYITGSDGEKDQSFTINAVTPEGEITNDLTMGEYLINVQSVPARDTLQDSQFDQCIAMREQGIAIPDRYVIQNSRLLDKTEIMQAMDDAANSPQAQQLQQLQLQTAEANLNKAQAEATRAMADAQNKTAQANVKQVQAETDSLRANVDNDQERVAIEQQRADIENRRVALEERKQAFDEEVQREELRLQGEKQRLDAVTDRLKIAQQAKAAEQQAAAAKAAPTPQKNGES